MRQLLGTLALAVLVGASAMAQSSDGFVSLFDGKTLNGWTASDEQYAKNFSVAGGLLHVEGVGGWLKSTKQYSDFIMRVEFRFVADTPIANSGVFVRTPATETWGRGYPSNSYMVRVTGRGGIRPASPADGRWTGAVLRFGAGEGPTEFDTGVAYAAYKKTGEWQTCEMQVFGGTITVTVNGRLLGRSYSVANPVGYVGIQAESGVTEYRSVQIRDLH